MLPLQDADFRGVVIFVGPRDLLTPLATKEHAVPRFHVGRDPATIFEKFARTDSENDSRIGSLIDDSWDYDAAFCSFGLGVESYDYSIFRGLEGKRFGGRVGLSGGRLARRHVLIPRGLEGVGRLGIDGIVDGGRDPVPLC